MITENGKYFLYRHIRNDKNEVFYIGIGTKVYYKPNNYNEIYRRAYIKSKRNIIWKRIVSKTNYRVEVICESNSYQFIQEKEKEFISLYGRISLKNGTLCNLTDGGEGQLGVRRKMTNETKKKISDSNKNKPKSETHRKRLSEAKLENPSKYWKNKKFSEGHKEKLKEAKKKQFENHIYSKSNRDRKIKLTKEERSVIYKEIGLSYTGTNSKNAKTFKIEYNGNVYIEKTTIRQIYLKYKISQFRATSILKTGKEYKGLKITLI
jgi:hypothetical protein